MEISKYKKSRTEKLTEKITIVVTPSMKADLDSMGDEFQIQEMTRDFFQEQIEKWKASKQAS